jgi:two-component system cell cycle response regulator CtrA
MRILLVEDDSATAQSIELMLKSEGFNVYTTDLGEEGVDLAKIYDYDLILLDLNLPDMSGLDVLRTIRVGKIDTPIMILTGSAEIDTKVKCFAGGADDYMTKPFHKDELVCRIRAVVRRSKGHAQSIITTGKISVNLDSKTVEVDGVRVHLTGKEYQMLELLSLRKGTTLTKEMFLNHLYGGMDEPELKIIDVFICKLRKKLSSYNDGKHHIETVWGRGYTMRDSQPVLRPADGVSKHEEASSTPPTPTPGEEHCLTGWKKRVYEVIPRDGTTTFKDVLEALQLGETQSPSVRAVLGRLIQSGLMKNIAGKPAAYCRVNQAQKAA